MTHQTRWASTPEKNSSVGAITANDQWRQKVANTWPTDPKLKALVRSSSLEKNWQEMHNRYYIQSSITEKLAELKEALVEKVFVRELVRASTKKSGVFPNVALTKARYEAQKILARVEKAEGIIVQNKKRQKTLFCRITEALAIMPEVAEILNKPAILNFEPS